LLIDGFKADNQQFYPEAFRFIGISGFIELTALGLWGFELIRNIQAGKRMDKERF